MNFSHETAILDHNQRTRLSPGLVGGVARICGIRASRDPPSGQFTSSWTA